jgi:hypothetical protein
MHPLRSGDESGSDTGGAILRAMGGLRHRLGNDRHCFSSGAVIHAGNQAMICGANMSGGCAPLAGSQLMTGSASKPLNSGGQACLRFRLCKPAQ